MDNNKLSLSEEFSSTQYKSKKVGWIRITNLGSRATWLGWIGMIDRKFKNLDL